MVFFLIPILVLLLSNLVWIIPVLLIISLASSIIKKTYRGAKRIIYRNDPDYVVEEDKPLSKMIPIRILGWFGGLTYRIARKIVLRLCKSSPALSHLVDRGFDFASKNGINSVDDVVSGVKDVAHNSVNHVVTSYAANKGIASAKARRSIESATNKIGDIASKAQNSAKDIIAHPEEARESVKAATQSFTQSIKNFFSRLFANPVSNVNNDESEHDNIESHPQGVSSALSNGITNSRHMISQAFGSTKHTVGRAAKRIEQSIENGINNTTELKSSVSAWKGIDWATGEGILPAIQTTAEGCASGFGLLKKLPGGKYLTGRDLRAASFVAAKFFPPAAIAMEAGRVVLNTGGRISDITDVTKKIYSNVISHHYLRAASGAFELFKIIAFNSGARRPAVVE